MTVYKHEIKKLEKAGVKVYGRTRGSFQFDQPGSCFSGGTCSIYAARPEKCRSFFCILQRKVMNGSVSFSDGSKLVIAVKTHAAWLTRRASQMSKKEEKNFQLRDFLVNYFKRDLERNFKGGTLARPPAKLSEKIKSKEQDIYHVHFEKGSKTKLHLHNGNQVLIATKGKEILRFFEDMVQVNLILKLKEQRNSP